MERSDDELLSRWEQFATPELLLLWSWFIDETLIRSMRGELKTREGMVRRVSRLYVEGCARQHPNPTGALVHQVLPYALWPGPHAIPWGAYVAHTLLTAARDKSSEARTVIGRVLNYAKSIQYVQGFDPYQSLHSAMWYELAKHGWEDMHETDELRLEEQRFAALLAGFASFAAAWMSEDRDEMPTEKRMYAMFGASSYLLLEHPV